MSLRDAIARAVAGDEVPGPMLEAAFGDVADGKASEVEIAALLVALVSKGESAEEIAGAAIAMRERVVPIPTQKRQLVDTCGTGGDRAGTFNISTAAALVAACASPPLRIEVRLGGRASSRFRSIRLAEREVPWT